MATGYVVEKKKKQVSALERWILHHCCHEFMLLLYSLYLIHQPRVLRTSSACTAVSTVLACAAGARQIKARKAIEKRMMMIVLIFLLGNSLFWTKSETQKDLTVYR
jgi:dipeptide/tripeptide permease